MARVAALLCTLSSAAALAAPVTRAPLEAPLLDAPGSQEVDDYESALARAVVRAGRRKLHSRRRERERREPPSHRSA